MLKFKCKCVWGLIGDMWIVVNMIKKLIKMVIDVGLFVKIYEEDMDDGYWIMIEILKN